MIEDWNGKTDVTINNVRLADAGIYECFEEGKRHEGQHSIMILIVRGSLSCFEAFCDVEKKFLARIALKIKHAKSF